MHFSQATFTITIGHRDRRTLPCLRQLQMTFRCDQPPHASPRSTRRFEKPSSAPAPPCNARLLSFFLPSLRIENRNRGRELAGLRRAGMLYAHEHLANRTAFPGSRFKAWSPPTASEVTWKRRIEHVAVCCCFEQF